MLALLSRPGALEALELAGEPRSANPKSHTTKMTARLFNSRAFDLARAGLLERAGSTYVQTELGRFVWKRYIPVLERTFHSWRRSLR